MHSKFGFVFFASLIFAAAPVHFTSLNSAQLWADDPQVAEISTDDVRNLLNKQKRRLRRLPKKFRRPTLC